MESSSTDLPHDNLDELLASPDGLARASQALVRLARSIVGDEGSAQEVVQSAWLEALRRPIGGRAGLGVGWLRSLVRSRAIDAKRRTARDRELEAALQERADVKEQLKSRLGIQREVLEAVEALHEPYRSTIYLRYFEGLSTQAISERLGVPLKTVRSHVWRAHGQLRERLARTQRNAHGDWSRALFGFAYGSPLLPGKAAASGTLALTVFGWTMKKLLLTVSLLVAVLFGWSRFDSWGDANHADVGAIKPTLEELDPLATDPETTSSHAERLGQRYDASPTSKVAKAPPATVGALEVRVVDPAGAPLLAQLVVELEHNSGRSSRLHIGAVDESGIALFSNLKPGTASIQCGRGESVQREVVEILAGETAQAKLVVVGGLSITGRVVDEHGAAIVGASVWLTTRATGWIGGAVATVADELGRFELAHVPLKHSLGAFAEGHGPSQMIDMERLETTGDSVDIELVLTSQGARLFGTVSDETGAPIAGALVVCGESTRSTQLRGDGTTLEHWTPRTASTDADGRYSFVGLFAGEPAVEVRSTDRALSRNKVKLRGGASARLDVVLSNGARVYGRVLDELGQPVAKALVFAHTDPVRRTFLQGGQVDYEGFLAYPAVESAADGSYRLEHVPLGEAFLCALEQAPEEVRGNPAEEANLQAALHKLEVHPGVEHEWNAVLSPGLVIEGRALYRDGKPITNTFVNITSESGFLKPRIRRSVFTTDGSFQFLNLEPTTYRVHVQAFNKPEGSSDPGARGLSPNQGLGGVPIEIVADFESPAKIENAHVSLRFEDAGERAMNDSVAVLMQQPAKQVSLFGSKSKSDSGGDLWSFVLDEPGQHRAIAMAGKRVIALGEPFEIIGGETLDLGVLRTKLGATLVLRTSWDPQHPPVEASGGLVTEGSNRGQRWEFDTPRKLGFEERRFESLEPGDCEVRLLGGSCCDAQFVAHLVAGQETTIEHRFVPGVKVPFSIKWDMSKSDEPMMFRVVDIETGTPLKEYPIENLTLYPNPIDWTLTIPLGRYRLELDRSGRPLHRQNFEVHAIDESVAKIAVSE